MAQTEQSSEGGSDGDQSQESRFSEDKISEKFQSRINQLTASFDTKLATAIQEVHNQYAEKKVEPKVWSREEINAGVTAGKITQAEANNILDNQDQKRTESTASRVAQQTIEAHNLSTTTQTSIAKYLAHDPDLKIKGTEARIRIDEEVAAQMKIHNVATQSKGMELAACRAIYGSEETLGGAEHNRQTHQETGGSGDTSQNDDDEGIPKGLSKRVKKYYEKAMNAGQYPGGWKDVKAELKRADPGVVERAKARYG